MSTRVIFVGPSGAGKGTQCARLQARLGVPHISSGDLFRAAVRDGTPLGAELAAIMTEGRLVPDDVTVGVVRERLRQPDAQAGFLLDGFPRTLPQAIRLGLALNEDSVRLDAVVLLEVADEQAVRRIAGRRMDPATGAIYHLDYAPPPPDVLPRLVQRADDTEAACWEMLAAYHSATEPLIALYEDRELLVRVDANGTPDEVHRRILDRLGIA